MPLWNNNNNTMFEQFERNRNASSHTGFGILYSVCSLFTELTPFFSWVRWYAFRFVLLVFIPFFSWTFILWEFCIVDFTLYRTDVVSISVLHTPYMLGVLFLPAFGCESVCMCLWRNLIDVESMASIHFIVRLFAKWIHL